MSSREDNEMAEEAHLDQFQLDLTSEPDMMTAEELHAINMSLEESYEKPIDWNKTDGII